MVAKRYNNLSGADWLKYSFSIWRDIRKTNEEKALKHPAMFPIQLASRIIEIFTKEKDLVLDPFMGVGSSIIAAYQKKRKGFGFDLSKEYVAIVKKRLKKLGIKKKDKLKPEIYREDARNLLKYIKKENMDLCVTSPPYWDILNMKRSADRKKIVKYSESRKDLGNIKDYYVFLDELSEVFKDVYEALKHRGFCVVIVMDIRKKSNFYPFHSDLADKMKGIGFKFEDIIIWDRQQEYNNMRPLGYPYAFRINKVHEYILIFRKI